MPINLQQALQRSEPDMRSTGFIYILSNTGRTTLYIGVTNDLKRRIAEHRDEAGSKFAAKYHLKDLLFYEGFRSITEAIAREKQLKNWHSAWKWNLIKAHNPALADLSGEI